MCNHLIVEKAMATHSSTLARKIPWREEPGRLQSMGSWIVGYDWAVSLSLSWIAEGNGNPLQCSCLDNPRDGGAWWAAIYGVTQSRTWLKRISSSSSSSSRSHCFNLYFSGNIWYKTYFHMPTGHQYILIDEGSVKVFSLFLNLILHFITEF